MLYEVMLSFSLQVGRGLEPAPGAGPVLGVALTAVTSTLERTT